jgi:PKD repeat protein
MRWTAFVCSLFCFATPAAAAPTARFVATRVQGTTCVAPCAVHFDAIGNGTDQTVDPAYGREFHTLLFEWDFGDVRAGTWSTTAASRNRAVGAIAGHLYETAGTYTVRLAATNPAGQSSTASQTLVVVDPNAAIAQANTWCFANSGTPGGAGFTACPAPAAQQRVVAATTANGFNSALLTCGAASRKVRCLFRSGDTFRGGSMVALGSQAGAGVIANFGSGARPRVVGGAGFIALGDGWTVAHLDVDLSGADPLFRLMPERSGTTVVDVRGTNLRGPCFESATGGGTRQSDRVGIFGLDCTNRGDSMIGGLYLRMDRALVYGNVIDGGYGGQFVVRTVHLARSVIAHNWLLRPQDDVNNRRNVMQLRAWSGTVNGASLGGPPPAPTQWVIVSDNVLGQSDSDAFVRTCQTNDCTNSTRAQNVQNLLFERNFLYISTGGTGGKYRMPKAFWLQGGDITVRNNVVDLQGIDTAAVYGSDGLIDHSANMASVPSLNDDRIQVLNNTVYYDDASRNNFTFCRGGAVGTAHVCRGNLAWLPNQTGQRLITDGGAWTSSQNLYAGTNPFVAAVPQQGQSTITSFRTSSSGPAADASYDFGTGEPSLRLDAGNRCRPADGGDADAIAHWDNGAFEANAGTTCRRFP